MEITIELKNEAELQQLRALWLASTGKELQVLSVDDYAAYNSDCTEYCEARTDVRAEKPALRGDELHKAVVDHLRHLYRR